MQLRTLCSVNSMFSIAFPLLNRCIGPVKLRLISARPRSIFAPAVLVGVTLIVNASASIAGESDQATAIDPAGLVLDMSTAIRRLNYQGRFVHIRDGDVNAMDIVHAYSGEGEQERMLSLVGEAREIIRNDSLVTCIWPGSESVIVSKSKPRNLLAEFDSSLIDNSMYKLELKDDDRVAGRAAHVVDVKPTDSMRYGYRFWIDQDTHMMLRSTLIDMNDSVIEQVMFTSIEFPDTVDAAVFEFDENHPSLTTYLEKPKPEVQLSTAERIQFEQLPSGYVKISENLREMEISDDPVSHVMVSDGMAAVSVYVEFVPQSQQQTQTLGHSSMGAMNAFGLNLGDAFVTVVGEVPKETVEAIASAVRIIQ